MNNFKTKKMSIYRSNLNSINNNVLQFARANDAHGNDALQAVLTAIYTAVPNAIIVQSGVNYRSATTDFQAWAIYYNPNYIFNPAAPNNLEIIDQIASENNFAYTGTYEIFSQADIGAGIVGAGNYFCMKTIDYNAPSVLEVLSDPIPVELISTVINSIGAQNYYNTTKGTITIQYEVAGLIKNTTFEDNQTDGTGMCSYQPVLGDINIMLAQPGIITGDALPADGTTGRFGILLNQYNTNIQ